jgi:hypothetical protein
MTLGWIPNQISINGGIGYDTVSNEWGLEAALSAHGGRSRRRDRLTTVRVGEQPQPLTGNVVATT